MAGNILGGRSYYGYTDDGGNDYSILQDDTLANAMGASPDDGNPQPPRRFKPRGVYVEAIIGGRKKRKFLIAPDATSAFYNSNVTQVFAIDGVNYDSTGRRGEALSFARNGDAQDVGDEDGVV
jgi:hypothetical protein